MTRIGVVAEVHMRSEYANSLVDELEWVADRFERDFEPDHVFVLGDVIQHGTSEAEDVRNVQRVADTFNDRSYPVTYLLGNHDVINLTRQDLESILGQERFYGTVTVGDNAFVYLDSALRNVETPSGMIGPAQLSFVQDAVQRDEDVFLLVHHPIGDFDLSDNPWFERFPEQAYLCDRKPLLEIARQAPAVKTTVSGHIHKNEHVEFYDIDHLSIGAFSKETREKPVTGTYAEMVIQDSTDVAVKVGERVVSRYQL